MTAGKRDQASLGSARARPLAHITHELTHGCALNQVSFIEKAAVQRMFQNPHDPNQFKESIDVKADPDELRHIDDPDVVRELCRT